MHTAFKACNTYSDFLPSISVASALTVEGALSGGDHRFHFPERRCAGGYKLKTSSSPGVRVLGALSDIFSLPLATLTRPHSSGLVTPTSRCPPALVCKEVLLSFLCKKKLKPPTANRWLAYSQGMGHASHKSRPRAPQEVRQDHKGVIHGKQLTMWYRWGAADILPGEGSHCG